MLGLPFSVEMREAMFGKAAEPAPGPAPFGKMASEVTIKMPPGDLTLVRYYYWPANSEPALDPVTLEYALASAESVDAAFETRAPQDLLKVIDKDAFAFQFVRVTNQMTKMGRLRSLFGAQAEYVQAASPQIYLIGEYDLSLKGELMLRTTTGSFILPDSEAQLLRRDDLRPVCCYYDASAPQAHRAP